LKQRDRCLLNFSQWSLQIPSAPDLVYLVTRPDELNLALEAFGRALFRHLRPRGEYINTILAIVDCRRSLRRQLSPAWDFAELWYSFMPGTNRVAMPYLLMEAFTAEGLSRGWVRWVAVLRLCFFGILRPGEVLSAKRRTLCLPSDLCRDANVDWRSYVGIVAPKTRLSAARQQYGRCDDWFTSWLWIALAEHADADAPLWEGTSNSFRAKWNVICSALGVPANESTGVTPASLRGGGASWLYEATEDMELVRHRGRWSSLKMCEIYIQEVGGHRFYATLPRPVRDGIAARASLAPAACSLALELLHLSLSPSNFYIHFAELACRTRR